MAVPADLTSKTLWLRAKDLAGADNSAVTAWTDQSGSGNDPLGFAAATLQTGETPAGGPAIRVVNGSITLPLLAPTTNKARASSRFNSGFPETALIDGLSSPTVWASLGIPSVGSPQWAQIELPAPTVVTSMKLYPAVTGRAPSAFTIQASDNPDGPWTTLDTRTGVAWPTTAAQTFSFSNDVAYRYYRLHVTATVSNQIVSLTEIELNGAANTIDRTRPAELWMVVRSAASDFAWRFGTGSGANYYPFTDGKVYDDFVTNLRRSFTPTIPINQWRLLRVTLDGSGDLEYRLDEASQLTATGAVAAWTYEPVLANSSQFDLAEVLLVTTPTSPTERAALITYFNTEHGLSVPGGSAAAVDAPALSLTIDTLDPAIPVAAPLLTLELDTLAPAISAPPIPAPLLTLELDTLAPSVPVAAPLLDLKWDTLAPSIPGQIIDAPLLTLTLITLNPNIPDAVESYAQAGTDITGPATATPDAAESAAQSGTQLDGPIGYETGDVETHAQTWATAIDLLAVAVDPATNRPQYRLRVVDMFGNEVVELPKAMIGTATRSLNSRGGIDFALPKNDPALADLAQFGEVQLWRGAHLVPGGWFVNVDPKRSAGANTVGFQCSGLRWYLEGRRIGKELPNLLTNGGFEQGVKGWTLGWSEGSNAEAPPDWEITTDARDGGKALRLFAKDVVVEITRTVETAAVFYGNRPYASEPLSAGFMPGGADLIRDQVTDIPQGASVTVEGHTADADAGTGYDLSVRRAQAAREVILAERPDLAVTAVGKGETEPVDPRHTEAAYRKNRRVVIKASGTQTKVGHRQWAGQTFRYTHPAAAKEPLRIDVQGQIRIDTWEGPAKDGWGLYADVRKVSDLAVIHNDGTVNVDETTTRDAWQPMHTSVTVPADSAQYEVTVRAYPTAGASSFDQLAAIPNLKLYFWRTDMASVLAGLVQHAQDPAYGKSDLNIDTLAPPTGYLMDESYEWARRQTVDSAIDNIVRMDNAPDVDVWVTPTRRVFTVHPGRKGRRTGLVLALAPALGDGRIVRYESGVDGDEVATDAWVQSSWSGGGQAEVLVREPRADGLVLERLYQAEQDASTTTLLEQGRTAVRYGRTDVLTKIWMDPNDTTFLLEQVDIGDTFTAHVDDEQTLVLADYRVIDIDLDVKLDQLAYTIAAEV